MEPSAILHGEHWIQYRRGNSQQLKTVAQYYSAGPDRTGQDKVFLQSNNSRRASQRNNNPTIQTRKRELDIAKTKVKDREQVCRWDANEKQLRAMR